MICAPLTPDEKERLEALYGYDILDTDAEKVFDDLTQLAADICQTPIALISLVDPNRQWFKAKVGINADETSREIAFCAHAIHQREIFEVCDASKDSRFHDNPLVTNEPNIRFYAGAPLITPTGYAIGTLCAISDEPKQLTESQKNALQILSREVISQLELRRTLKQTQNANEFKTEFLSSMSHEIRTPLNAIIGFSRILLEQSKTLNLPENFSSYLADIDFSSKHLLGIVNSVLDLSKIEAGKMEVLPNWFSSQEFIKKLCHMLAIKAQEKGVILGFDIDNNLPDYLFLDQQKLSQILINLLNNAIKFTPQNKRVNVLATINNQTIAFIIQDEGIGISKNDQVRLFEKFNQLGKQHSEGTGLGLTITKHLVELMHGSITLESELNQGTRITVSIPLPNTEIPKNIIEQTNPSKNNSIKQPNILVVEDNAINRKLANAIFSSLGHQVDFAESGEQALISVQEKTYDLIYMDIHMPGISGIEAATQIHQNFPDSTIIALTADIFELQKQHENGYKFDDYLSKPLIKEELIETINKFS